MSDHIKIDNSKVPSYVTHVTSILKNGGFEAFLVGGCVRDLIIGREPKDWDVTTNAKPEEIINLFEKTVYENSFGTVAVCVLKKDPQRLDLSKEVQPLGKKSLVTHETEEEYHQSRGWTSTGGTTSDWQTLRKQQNVTHETETSVTLYEELSSTGKHVTKYNIVEVTPYRIESKYTDFRHPDKVEFSNNIEDDLKRRDFTMNALALDIDNKGQLIDLYKGQDDIKDKVIRAVGSANIRFKEDALRMLRAVRFSTELGFAIDYETMKAIVDNASLLKEISEERIRDEFIKIIESKNPSMGVAMLSKLGLLKYMIPELEEGIGCIQGGAHIYDVFEHCLQALNHASEKKFSTEVRLAALFHDIGKPRSRRAGNKKEYTFYGHEVIGERIVKKIMERLKFPKKTSELVTSFVRNHMFFSDTETITLSAVRRIVQKVAKENVWELMNVRECDRVGMKKAEAPYRLRKYHAMIEEVLHDPISVGQLKINGETLIKELHMKPGPRMGWVLSALLEEVLENPEKNTREYLIDRVKELDSINDEELKKLGESGKEKKEEAENKEIEKLHKKHGV